MNKTLISTAILVLVAATLAHGQGAPVRVAFNNGQVTLTATDALLTDVLSEWARVGGTDITGADQLPVIRVTVSLPGVAERDAIDAVLGAVAGYMSAMRPDAPAGTSMFRKLQIVMPSKDARTRVTRVIDASLPESNFEYPSSTFDAETLTANPNGMPPPSPALSEPQVMPEMRYQYVDPAVTMPMPQEEPESKPGAKPDPKAKKPPSGF